MLANPSKPTIKDQLKDLTEKLTSLTDQVDQRKLEHLETELKAAEVNIANQANTITGTKAELVALRTDLDKFKRDSSSELDKIKRELMSYIILSNASKELDVAKLTESAQHLASGITPASIRPIVIPPPASYLGQHTDTVL
uniref:Uncharacterized protein n=1 Tax=Pithovirus LCPAC103 TaxID=2506588 RepID=A0A481Z389_9VIRU|nr:MAG: hypothetical protein LCPAC103_00240 [Pithovirus LCPAC103]